MSVFIALGAFLSLQAADCGLDEAERARLLALDEEAFDQDMDGGWRAVAAPGPACFTPAAELILAYVEQHGEAALERPTLAYWHAGQMFAMAGETERALTEFRRSYQDATDNEMAGMWNRYADGTIAFLERDREALIAARDALPAMMGSNRDVLDGFVNCWDRPIMEAYQRECRTPASEP